MKTVCERHGIAYEVSEGCLYCTPAPVSQRKPSETPTWRPEANKKTDDEFPRTMDELDILSTYYPDKALDMMDGKFGTGWRGMTEEQITDMLDRYFESLDDPDYLTPTND